MWFRDRIQKIKRRLFALERRPDALVFSSLSIKGTREIRVILYAKADSFCATALADELSVEDTLAIEHDVIPLDGADVFQQGEIDSIGDRVALAEDPGDFPPPPVNDAGQDQVKTTAGLQVFICSHSSRALIRPRRP
jgi:hypothetical protein